MTAPRPLDRRRPLVMVLALGAALAGCAGASRTTFPPLGSTPQAPGDATAAASQQVIGALESAGLQVADAVRAYRPPEGALLAAAPRTVLQVVLPDDPTHGYIVVYALASPAHATAAATDHAAYIASGTGNIYFPTGTQFVVRVVGAAVVFFSWAPGSSPDSRMATIAPALETIGIGVQIPR